MVRPKAALISRRIVLEAALAIIDEDGLEGLSIRRLANRLGVNGASLYHHFDNKDAILVGATELALEDVRTPATFDEDWHHWLARSARSLRTALLRHPALVSVVASKRSLGMGARALDACAERLAAEGLPSAAIMPLLDALELFAIGSALHQTRGYVAEEARDFDPVAFPSLARAIDERGLSADEIFDLVIVSIFNAFETVVKEHQARWLPGVQAPGLG